MTDGCSCVNFLATRSGRLQRGRRKCQEGRDEHHRSWGHKKMPLVYGSL
ncbi:hypothetical protein OIU78_026943 [Salix suchowensis]|nr:hypothetical protein OIU78_026943 [Salix suchowensis]